MKGWPTLAAPRLYPIKYLLVCKPKEDLDTVIIYVPKIRHMPIDTIMIIKTYNGMSIYVDT